VSVGPCGQLGPGIGQQRLVPGHHRPSGIQRRLHQRPGRIEPADQLHHHVDPGSGDQRRGVVGEQLGGHAGRPGPPEIAHGDPTDR
jgi:hypothetical protein